MVGNISNFTRYDVIRCFLAIKDNPSRQSLTKRLDIGEGTIRTILDKLKDKGLIESKYQGHIFTDKGKTRYKAISDFIEIKNNVKIDVYKEKKLKNTALLLKTNKKVKFDIFQRDVAIKNGADSCLIFDYEKGKLNLPLLKMNIGFDGLRKEFEMKENNILIVTFSKENRWTEIAALAVAEELLNEEKISIFKDII